MQPGQCWRANKLTQWNDAFQVFPARQARFRWLVEQIDGIMDRGNPAFRRSAAMPATRTKPTRQPRPVDRSRRTAAAVAVGELAPLPAPLPQIAIDIPFKVELDLTPLMSATTRRPEQDGRWWRLRERFAHLGLAQGFDELLCLPHLVGVEPLLAPGRDRAQSAQAVPRPRAARRRGRPRQDDRGRHGAQGILRCAAWPSACWCSRRPRWSGNGARSWRRNSASSFATTHDPLLREDPQAFWTQKRIIASIAAARRREHAERLRGHNFDLVVVDEAHHLRDRSSQSWKLVDALNKRFLLLLSATPVQNDLVELYNLLTLLKPGIFKTLKEFRSAYMTPGKPRRTGQSERLRELMRGAMIRNTRARRRPQAAAPPRATLKVDGGPAETAAYAELAAAARRFAARAHGTAAIGWRCSICSSAAGSSPTPLRRAFARFAARHPDDAAWQALADALGGDRHAAARRRR